MQDVASRREDENIKIRNENEHTEKMAKSCKFERLKCYLVAHSRDGHKAGLHRFDQDQEEQ